MSPDSTEAVSEALELTYSTIAEWLLYPEEIDPDAIDADAADAVERAARRIDLRAAGHLRAFWEGRDTVDAEGYLELLELEPKAPLYLGTYQFSEPASCSAAGVSDRNQYMIEIGNIYRHFSFEITGELPDYLPAMTEFLALSCGQEGSDAALRVRFIERMVLDGARLFAERLEEVESIYARLAQALVLCLEREVALAAHEPVGTEGSTDPVEGAEPGQPSGSRATVLTLEAP
jgi:nitrate reductase assembly molybdenum cofactor insertion protein NarJ